MREPMQAVWGFWFWICIPLNLPLTSGNDDYHARDTGRGIKEIIYWQTHTALNKAYMLLI